MIDCYFDEVSLERIDFIPEGMKLVLKNKSKDETLMIVLNEDEFLRLHYAIKRRCETKNLIPVFNTDKFKPFKPYTDKLRAGIARCRCGVEFLDKSTKYCGNCGQALDWSDDK